MEEYKAATVAGDILAILDDLEIARAAIAGHDIGGMVAWCLASKHPDRVERLAAISSPHPIEYVEGRKRPEMIAVTSYVDNMLTSPATEFLQPRRLSAWLENAGERAELEAALTHSDLQSVANYYRANLSDSSDLAEWPTRVACPTLVMFGTADPFIPRFVYENTLAWVEGVLTVERVPGHGHFMYTAPKKLSAALKTWLQDH